MKSRITLAAAAAFVMWASLAHEAHACVTFVNSEQPEYQTCVIVTNYTLNIAAHNHLAEIQVEQVLTNHCAEPVGGLLLIPLPEGAVVDAFSLTVDGSTHTATLMSTEEAWALYMEQVTNNGDPAILGLADYDVLQAALAPMDTGESRTIAVDYRVLVSETDDVARLHIPVSKAELLGNPIHHFEVTASLQMDRPIKNIFTPYQDAVIHKPDNHHAQLQWNANYPGAADFDLYWAMSAQEFAINLFSYRYGVDGAQVPGYFLLLISPKSEIELQDILPKNISFVLDKSGSMSGQKIEQAKEALQLILGQLNEFDTFSLTVFSDEVEVLTTGMMPATAGNVEQAQGWVGQIEAGGGTNIHDAFLTGMDQFDQSSQWTNMVVFLTDGLATVGKTANEAILDAVTDKNTFGAKIFTFGVGYDVNIHLLDQVSQDHNGFPTYIRPGENIQEKLGKFYSTISTPLLTDLTLDYGSANVTEVFPQTLQDLYLGSQLVVIGRYASPGETTVTLTGMVGSQPVSIAQQVHFKGMDTGEKYLPRLWATRKIGLLLDLIRLGELTDEEKQALIDQIIALSMQYGIVTPYTSFAVDADGNTNNSYNAPSDDESGAGAMEDSDNINGMKNGTSVGEAPSDAVKHVGDKTFVYRNWYWTDTLYPDGTPTQSLLFSSPEYFDFLMTNSEAALYAAIGHNVVFEYGGNYYRITDPNIMIQTLLARSHLIASREAERWNHSEGPSSHHRAPADLGTVEQELSPAVGCQASPRTTDPYASAAGLLLIPLILMAVRLRRRSLKRI